MTQCRGGGVASASLEKQARIIPDSLNKAICLRRTTRLFATRRRYNAAESYKDLARHDSNAF
jgi:hypothetical protein